MTSFELQWEGKRHGHGGRTRLGAEGAKVEEVGAVEDEEGGGRVDEEEGGSTLRRSRRRRPLVLRSSRLLLEMQDYRQGRRLDARRKGRKVLVVTRVGKEWSHASESVTHAHVDDNARVACDDECDSTDDEACNKCDGDNAHVLATTMTRCLGKVGEGDEEGIGGAGMEFEGVEGEEDGFEAGEGWGEEGEGEEREEEERMREW